MVTTQLVTAEQLLDLETSERHYELIEGVLKQAISRSPERAFILGNLAGVLGGFVAKNKLARVYAGGPLILLGRDPDTVLAPDMAVVRRDRLPLAQSAFISISPDLVIEVVSPGNSPGEIERKVGIYLASGVRSIWIVYPRQRQVTVFSPENPPQIFSDADVITANEILPGLAVDVSRIFDD